MEPSRYDTPTYLVDIVGADLTEHRIIVTFRQGRRMLEFDNDDFTSLEIDKDNRVATVGIPFRQLQTARFRFDQPVRVQASVVDHSQYRASTDIKETTLEEQLLEVPRYHG